MYLNIKPVQIDGLDCFEILLATVAAHYNREYQLAFSEALGFEYLQADSESTELIGNRINTGNKNIVNLHKKYCGIDTKRIEIKTAEGIIDVIKQQLHISLPTIISINTYYCPWHGDYHKLSHGHFCLATGIDADNNITCIDPGQGSGTFYLPNKDFMNGFGLCYVFDIAGSPEIKEYMLILRDSVEKIRELQHTKKIESFAKDFSTELNFDEEFRNINISLQDVHLQRNLDYVAGGRFLYYTFIQYLAVKMHCSDLLEISNKLLHIKGKWHTAKGVIVKGYYAGCTEKAKEKACSIFQEIIELEENLLSNLYDIVYAGYISNRINVNDLNTIIDNSIQVKDFVYIDLLKYLNKIAFHSSISNDCMADFTGMGDYFLSENVPDNQIINVVNMRFMFPVISDNSFDNISCMRQTIIVPQDKYNGIMILASAEWGNFVEHIKLEYTSSENIDVLINFSDWWQDIPLYDEHIAWSGKAYSKKIKRLSTKNLNIFSIFRPLLMDKILKSIILPDCPNIHIFAITLCKG